MVTNLPAEAKAKFVKYMEAKTPEEKLRALEEFLSAVPKHKGTENLVRWIRKRMAELREEIEEQKRKRSGGKAPSFFIEKEGAAQIVLLGYTKVGKSSLLRVLTGARVEVTDYPYATRVPVPGMLQYEDIQFQLVEAPSLIPGGGGWNPRVIGLGKNSDGIALVLDLSQEPVEAFKAIVAELQEHGLYLVKPKGYVVIEKKRGIMGIRIINYGKLLCAPEDVIKLLNSYRIYNAIVKVYGEVDLNDVEMAIYENVIYKPTIILANKVDLPNTIESLKELMKVVPRDIPIIPVSALKRINLDKIGPTLFKVLDLIRVYTKPPLGEPSKKPLVLKRGSTVLDVAKAIHSELVEKFLYARIWGPSAKYPGQRVGLDHVLQDGDIVEINLRK